MAGRQFEAAGLALRFAYSIPALALLLAAALWALGAEASRADESVCAQAAPTGVEGLELGQVKGETDFIRVDVLPHEQLGGDGPHEGEIVSFHQDVLLRSPASEHGVVVFRSSNLHVNSIICIKYRPEMLALVVQNAGATLLDVVMRAEVIRDGATSVLYGRLPPFDTGEKRSLLLSSSTLLADADEITLEIQSSDGNPASR
jgi:hypothetical protein